MDEIVSLDHAFYDVYRREHLRTQTKKDETSQD